ncbi:sensor histidine kinase [Streptomyces sp. NPDC059928]|uniref:sensor histidine kinase n=1 Tax=unclassified Streptomyces TaxID=2593676 RepID=UPI003660071E
MRTDAVGRARGERVAPAGRALPRHRAIVITTGVLLGFFVIDGSFVWFEHPPLWQCATAVLGFAAILALQISHSFPSLFPRLSRFRYATWGLQGLLAYLPISLFGVGWGGMTAFFTASAALVFPPAVGWPLFCFGFAGDLAVFAHFETGWSYVAYAGVEALLIPLTVIGLSRMSDMIVKLRRSREELSRLAVAGERLRFARDLHEVVGFGLSAVALKCELAHRLLERAPARAQDELAEVLRTSRKALADVRAVSRGYREMSLSGEAQAAVPMLSAAGIRMSLAFDEAELPRPVDTVLAAVLREGLTNMLRHSKAEWCELRAERQGAAVVVALVNDGLGRGRSAKSGTGGALSALGERVASLGGTLAHGPDGRGRFHLRAVVPVPDGAGQRADACPARAIDADDAEQPVVQPRGLGHRDMVPRAAGAVTFAVLVGYFLAYSVLSLSFELPLLRSVALMLCLSAMLLVQLAVSFQWRLAWAARRPWLVRQGAFCALVLLQVGPPLFLGRTCLGMPGFLAGTALLVLPTTVAWPVFAVVVVGGDLSLQLADGSLQDLIYQSAYTPICGVVVFGLSRMAQLACELHRSRTEIARLAVTTERLRFARDLHDLLGFSLSAITLKCELVRRLATSRPAQARQELTEVLGIAREALADVRTVASGSLRMCLTAEAEHATAMLAGVGIRATVRMDCGELPGEVETVLATTLREGLTNMLRHSRAEHCEITAERAAGGVRLRLVNDGAQGFGEPVLGSRTHGGSGIGNLTTRVEAVNGRLTAGPRPDGRFELRAEVELLAA